MKILAAGFLLTVSLYGQYGHQRFSWQEACFKNFGLPYCQGHDFAIKPQQQGKNQAGHAVEGDFDSFPATNVTPSEVVAGAIDWRFADPSSETLVGFRARRLATLPLARKVIAQLGANMGLTPMETEKMLDRLSGVEQVAISAGQSQTIVMVTGRESDLMVPPLDPGWKATEVAGNALLIGQADAVDQATQRLAKDDPPSVMMRLAMKRQADNEFWAIGFSGPAGQEANSTKVKGLSIQLSIRDHLTSALALEFSGPPDAKVLQTWAPTLKGAVEGNVVHVATTIEPDEIQQKLGQVLASPIREYLTAVVRPSRYIPAHEAGVPKQAKPVIQGLD